MEEVVLSACPCCGLVPKLAYVCSEYFIFSEDSSCECNEFPLMCSNGDYVAKKWNEHVANMV